MSEKLPEIVDDSITSKNDSLTITGDMITINDDSITIENKSDSITSDSKPIGSRFTIVDDSNTIEIDSTIVDDSNTIKIAEYSNGAAFAGYAPIKLSGYGYTARIYYIVTISSRFKLLSRFQCGSRIRNSHIKTTVIKSLLVDNSRLESTMAF